MCLVWRLGERYLLRGGGGAGWGLLLSKGCGRCCHHPPSKPRWRRKKKGSCRQKEGRKEGVCLFLKLREEIIKVRFRLDWGLISVWGCEWQESGRLGDLEQNRLVQRYRVD